MVALTKFYSLVENLAEKVFNLQTDQLVVALTAAANAPVVTNAVLADLVQVAYTNLSTRNITTLSSSQTLGLYKLMLQDLVLTASGGPSSAFRYIVIYDDTPTSPADPLIGFADYANSLTLGDGESLTLDFDGTNGAVSMQ